MKTKISNLEEKILKESLFPDLIRDLMDWAKNKYSRLSCKSKLLIRINYQNLYLNFLNEICDCNWHKNKEGFYFIINYLSHGEKAPMPIHIRLILDSNIDKYQLKKYLNNIEFECE